MKSIKIKEIKNILVYSMVNKTIININGLTFGGKAIHFEGFGSIHIKNHAGESTKIESKLIYLNA